MLKDVQRDTVIALLEAQPGFKASPRTWLMSLIPDNAFMDGLSLLLPSVGQHARVAVKLCEDDKWSHDPPWIVRLLTALTTYPGIPELIAELKIRPPEPDDPFRAFVLHGKLPFLDRASLREKVRTLARTLERCILVVNGAPVSGKSYTARYLDYLSYTFEEFGVAPIFEAGGGADLQPEQLAKDIVAAMERPTNSIPDRGAASVDRWVKELTTWILSEAAQTGRKWWIVLDGFNSGKLGVKGTPELIQHLADRISRGETRKRMRLVLLDYPDPFPIDLLPSVEVETIASGKHIGDVDVRDYFSSLLKARSQNFDATAVAEATNRVLTRVPDSPRWLFDLAAQIKEVSDAL